MMLAEDGPACATTPIGSATNRHDGRVYVSVWSAGRVAPDVVIVSDGNIPFAMTRTAVSRCLYHGSGSSIPNEEMVMFTPCGRILADCHEFIGNCHIFFRFTGSPPPAAHGGTFTAPESSFRELFVTGQCPEKHTVVVLWNITETNFSGIRHRIAVNYRISDAKVIMMSSGTGCAAEDSIVRTETLPVASASVRHREPQVDACADAPSSSVLSSISTNPCVSIPVAAQLPQPLPTQLQRARIYMIGDFNGCVTLIFTLRALLTDMKTCIADMIGMPCGHFVLTAHNDYEVIHELHNNAKAGIIELDCYTFGSSTPDPAATQAAACGAACMAANADGACGIHSEGEVSHEWTNSCCIGEVARSARTSMLDQWCPDSWTTSSQTNGYHRLDEYAPNYAADPWYSWCPQRWRGTAGASQGIWDDDCEEDAGNGTTAFTECAHKGLTAAGSGGNNAYITCTTSETNQVRDVANGAHDDVCVGDTCEEYYAGDTRDLSADWRRVRMRAAAQLQQVWREQAACQRFDKLITSVQARVEILEAKRLEAGHRCLTAQKKWHHICHVLELHKAFNAVDCDYEAAKDRLRDAARARMRAIDEFRNASDAIAGTFMEAFVPAVTVM